MRRRGNGRQALALNSVIYALILLAACSPAKHPSQPPAGALPFPTVQDLPVATSPSVDPQWDAKHSPAIECLPPAESSPAMAEGPYFKAGSPARASLLEASTPGE